MLSRRAIIAGACAALSARGAEAQGVPGLAITPGLFGSLRKLSGLYWTSAAGNPNGFTTVGVTNTSSTATALPTGTKKIICFAGYGGTHIYTEVTAAQWGANTYNFQWFLAASPAYVQITKGASVGFLSAQSDGGSSNSLGGAASDFSKLFPNTDATNQWLAIEFYG